jgi:hypothetical protein
MSWRAITEDDIRSAMSGPEDTAYRSKLLASGQSDPLVEIIAQVTLEFREAIRTCAANRLHEDGDFLPGASIRHAVAIIRHRLLTRFDVGAVGEARLMEYREATRYLDAVAACKRAVEQPDGTEDARQPLPSPVVNANPRRFRWDNQDGI